MRILFVLIFAFAFVPHAAHASFFVNCEAVGDLSETDTTGTYMFTPTESSVTGGYATKGEPCMKDKIGKEIKIKVQGPVETGDNVTLKYRYYNAMGEDGVVESETWTAKD